LQSPKFIFALLIKNFIFATLNTILSSFQPRLLLRSAGAGVHIPYGWLVLVRRHNKKTWQIIATCTMQKDWISAVFERISRNAEKNLGRHSWCTRRGALVRPFGLRGGSHVYTVLKIKRFTLDYICCENCTTSLVEKDCQ
jgi:hypothetical protein